MFEKVKRVLFEIMEGDDRFLARFVDIFLLLLILLNVVVVLLETVADLNALYGDLFFQFEVLSVVVFTLEYLLRLWVCTQREEYAGDARARLRYTITPMALVDLAAILPFYRPCSFLSTRGCCG
jgi:voltage-gated potassium channel